MVRGGVLLASEEEGDATSEFYIACKIERILLQCAVLMTWEQIFCPLQQGEHALRHRRRSMESFSACCKDVSVVGVHDLYFRSLLCRILSFLCRDLRL